jgi:hypothetical protein
VETAELLSSLMNLGHPLITDLETHDIVILDCIKILFNGAGYVAQW